MGSMPDSPEALFFRFLLRNRAALSWGSLMRLRSFRRSEAVFFFHDRKNLTRPESARKAARRNRDSVAGPLCRNSDKTQYNLALKRTSHALLH